jgi:hypothetical protein
MAMAPEWTGVFRAPMTSRLSTIVWVSWRVSAPPRANGVDRHWVAEPVEGDHLPLGSDRPLHPRVRVVQKPHDGILFFKWWQQNANIEKIIRAEYRAWR